MQGRGLQQPPVDHQPPARDGPSHGVVLKVRKAALMDRVLLKICFPSSLGQNQHFWNTLYLAIHLFDFIYHSIFNRFINLWEIVLI